MRSVSVFLSLSKKANKHISQNVKLFLWWLMVFSKSPEPWAESKKIMDPTELFILAGKIITA